MYLGNNINYLMAKHNLSRKELADSLNVKDVQIGKYIKESSYPRLEGLLTLAKIFNVSLQDLVMKDLSKEEGRPFAGEGEEKADETVKELNELLRLRIAELERELKRNDPDLAKELGIK